jgi:hypothetical protein
MAEPTLQEIFGANATQTATDLVIKKSDLTTLTATSDNRGESLLVAILLKAKAQLTQTNFDSNLDQNVLLADGYSSLTTRGNVQYRQDQISITLAKPDLNSTIDPDDY